MNLFQFIKSKIFLKNFLISIGVTLLLIIILSLSFRFYTHHGEEFTVPNYIGKLVTDISDVSAEGNLGSKVIDSIYDPAREAGMIVNQEPLPGTKVKRNRIVYLTIIAKIPEMVKMPDLIDLSLRQATAMLESYGLVQGNLSYSPDIAKNAVLKQIFQGSAIKPATLIRRGSKIDLVLGSGAANGRIQVPFLIGKKQSEALKILAGLQLTIGTEIFDDGKDTIHSRIYKQEPNYVINSFLNPGEKVNVWYRSDKKFDFNQYIKDFVVDTLTDNEE